MTDSDPKSNQGPAAFLNPETIRFLDQLPFYMFIKDRDSVYVYCSPAYAAEMDRHPGQFIGRNDYDFHPSRMAGAYIRDDREVMRTQQVKTIIETFETKGKTRWVKTLKTPCRNKEGQVVGLFGIFEDITEEKQLREMLEKKEEEYRLLVEHQQDLICRWLPDTTITFVNDSYCRFFGKTRDQLMGSPWIELISEEGREPVRQYYRSLASHPRVNRSEHEVTDKDGKTVWHEWIDTPLFDAREKLTEFQSIGRDVTAFKQAKKHLSAHAYFFSQLLSLTSEGFWRVDNDLRLLEVNEQACTLLGYTREEMLGLNITDIDAIETPADTRRHTEEIDKIGFDIFQTRHRKKDGTLIDVEVRVASWNTDEGIVRLSFIRDISDKKKLDRVQKELAVFHQTDQIKKNFFSRITHEVMTPLNAILGFSRMLSKNPNLTHEQRNQAEIITAGAARLEKTLKEYIFAAGMDSPYLEKVHAPFDLFAMFESLARPFQARCDALGIPLQVVVADPFPKQVAGDEEKIRFILEHLLEDVPAFSGPEGMVATIGRRGFSQPDDTRDHSRIHLVVTVEYKGRKIEETVLKRLAQPDDPADLSAHDGKELPWSAPRFYADLMGGKLCAGNHPGKRGYVQLTLPLEYSDGYQDLSRKDLAQRITGFARTTDLTAEPSDHSAAALPDDLRIRLRQALAQGNMVRFVEQVHDAGSLSPRAARDLVRLAEAFDYPGLDKLLGRKEDRDDL